MADCWRVPQRAGQGPEFVVRQVERRGLLRASERGRVSRGRAGLPELPGDAREARCPGLRYVDHKWELFNRDADHSVYIAGWLQTGIYPTRAGRRLRGSYPWVILPCKDGEFFLLTLQDEQWRRFLDLIGDPEWSHSER